MNLLKTNLFVLTILSIFTFSCNSDNDDVDLEKPVINILEIGELEGNEYVIHIGDTINFKALFTDNNALRKYEVDIHYGGGHDHDHDHRLNASSSEEGVEFKHRQSFDISGTQHEADWIKDDFHIVVVPENTKPGTYHFGVHVTDVEGNDDIVYNDVIFEDAHHDHDHDH
ncbi:DUF4625 domain-containing protein [Aureibacter tunicatorum]|uniref:DUF4625 domain-containing protein n=1 Tax=Aureibacter tunicatorum TaxID=866807 RepID=A0AAE3XQ61_9BACT|nr:DUF4625 domain-containing protein [Aureibacter tunicatorum]MDR6239329.1 hypothetical protein [Aureibacter tunicatorum]BDD04748.1 hypothetical protein AUTU_22310 [Aureibacter tunicatorum]